MQGDPQLVVARAEAEQLHPPQRTALEIERTRMGAQERCSTIFLIVDGPQIVVR